FPSKIEPILRTSVNGGNVQLFVDIEVPVNPTHKGCYAVEQLGQVCDPRGLIGVKHELLTISVIVQCHVDVELKSMTLNIHEIANVSEPQLPPAPPVEQYRGHFLENIERSQQQKQQTRRIDPSQQWEQHQQQLRRQRGTRTSTRTWRFDISHCSLHHLWHRHRFAESQP
uniref:DUF4773 domain-containing protein n=1 Tax=Globodera pallida TaxID=36090 RepID=A0A183CT00_GLOPA